jgi:hypothetical protein
MKKQFTFYLFALCITLIFNACGFILEEAGKDKLVGYYSGKLSRVYKYSLLNVGKQDYTNDSNVKISIFKTEHGDTYLITPDGMIKISKISYDSDGTSFCIPYQMVPQKKDITLEIEGSTLGVYGDDKFDGFLFDESQALKFAYNTLIDYEYYGQKTQVMVICTFTCTKNK